VPDVRPRDIRVDQAIVISQIVRRQRRVMPLEVFWAGADRESAGRELSRNQRRFLQIRCDPDCQIEALVRKIDRPVIESDLDRNQRMPSQEFGQRRCDVQNSE